MAKQKRNNKIVKYRRIPMMNIGTIMFGILFIYMIICLVMYVSSPHIAAYEVVAGPLSGNYRYTAFSFKEEMVIPATQSGNVSYYAREGSKIGNGSTVCSIDEGGTLSFAVANASSALAENADKELLSKIRSSMSVFASDFDPESYQNVYNFKSDMESSMLELTSEQSLSQLGAEQEQGVSNLVNLCTAPKEGIVVYSTDGYENLEQSKITTATFDQKNYHKTNLRSNKNVASGDSLYKLLTDENWSLIIPLDEKLATELEDRTSIKFRFLKDNTTFAAGFSIFQNGKEFFGKLTMSNSLIRYSAERFLDIELILNRKTGLKIPNSAVTEKVFYKIPKKYATYDEENPKEIGILRESTGKKGAVVTKYITATVYNKTETDFYVDSSLFSEGDYAIMKDSSNKYHIKEKELLQGVYNINKGYAVFREIKLIDQNEEYCIVADGSTFGLAQFDHILLDASTVSENAILY